MRYTVKGCNLNPVTGYPASYVVLRGDNLGQLIQAVAEKNWLIDQGADKIEESESWEDTLRWVKEFLLADRVRIYVTEGENDSYGLEKDLVWHGNPYVLIRNMRDMQWFSSEQVKQIEQHFADKKICSSPFLSLLMNEMSCLNPRDAAEWVGEGYIIADLVGNRCMQISPSLASEVYCAYATKAFEKVKHKMENKNDR